MIKCLIIILIKWTPLTQLKVVSCRQPRTCVGLRKQLILPTSAFVCEEMQLPELVSPQGSLLHCLSQPTCCTICSLPTVLCKTTKHLQVPISTGPRTLCTGPSHKLPYTDQNSTTRKLQVVFTGILSVSRLRDKPVMWKLVLTIQMPGIEQLANLYLT